MTDSVSLPHSMQPLSMADGAALGLMLSACRTGDSPQSMATSTTDASVTASSATDTLRPVVATAAVLNDSDDPAIWIDTLNPSRSLVIGTDKGDSTGVAFGGKLIGITVAAERGTRSLRIFRLRLRFACRFLVHNAAEGVCRAHEPGLPTAWQPYMTVVTRVRTRGPSPVLSAIALSTVTTRANLYGVAVHPATIVHFGSSAGRLSRFSSALTARRSTFHTRSSCVV